MSKEEERGIYILSLETSRYCADSGPSVLSTLGPYYRGVPRNPTVELYRYYRPDVGSTEGLAKTHQ
jgi:hypothetical protein